ncbi:hypothetical protein Tco_0887412 [Tanacetum coccineum]
MTPFQAVYGRVPPRIISYPPGSSKVADVDELLVERDALLRQLKQNVLVSKQRMETQYNRTRRDVEFEILERVGTVAYRLALSDSSKIHPHEGHPMEQPLAICATRVVLQNGIPAGQVLVQWNGSSPEEATWEWLIDFHSAYPTYNLKDKMIFKGEGNVTPTLQEEGRPKRVTTIPVWHKDYVMG